MIHERDRHTHTETPRDGIASRGKKIKSVCGENCVIVTVISFENTVAGQLFIAVAILLALHLPKQLASKPCISLTRQ